MIRKLSAIFFISIAVQAFSANVLWNAFYVDDAGRQSICVENWSEQGPNIWTGVLIGVRVKGDVATITANPGGTYLLMYGGGWLPGMAGDIVSADTMLGRSSYFSDGILGQAIADENPLSVEVGTANYLKVVVQDADQCFDYDDGYRTEMPDCYYGWVEYSVNSSGKIDILQSALDVSGAAMIVGGGAIPEPSSALLLLVGLAGLGLKRKRIVA